MWTVKLLLRLRVNFIPHDKSLYTREILVETPHLKKYCCFTIVFHVKYLKNQPENLMHNKQIKTHVLKVIYLKATATSFENTRYNNCYLKIAQLLLKMKNLENAIIQYILITYRHLSKTFLVSILKTRIIY